MKVVITSKNYKPSERLQENIEKKFSKLGKYFQDDVTANVLVSKFKDKTKVEATINGNKTIFRAEEISDNVYEAIDLIIDKLSNQMTKFKGRLEKRYKGNKEAIKFEFMPDEGEDEEAEDLTVVRRKTFDLQPMGYEEAILQMEMLGHNFFVYLDMDTDSVNVVYKRKGDAYGLIETRR
jgi:putative sigma-54 modulation protein